MTCPLERMREFDCALQYSTDRDHCHVDFMGTEGIKNAMDAVREANNGELSDTQIVYDMDSVLTTLNSCKNSFDDKVKCQLAVKFDERFISPFTHCYAVKASPVSYILHTMVQNGMGMECASINEVHQSIR